MVVLDPEDIPDFKNIKDEDLKEKMQEIFPGLLEKLKNSELFTTRFMGLMNEIQQFCKLDYPPIY